MLQEVGRVLTAIVALIVAVAGRVWRGMQWLVRHARATRAVTAQGTPRLGRLLDLAALSAAADVLILAELWRRGLPPGSGWAALVGVFAAVAIGVALHLTPRNLTRIAWSGLTLIRIIALAVLALAPPVFLVSGGTGSSRFLATLAVATLAAMVLVDRHAWAVSMRTLVAPLMRGRFVAGTLSYVAYTVPWAIVLALLTLMFGGLWPLILAETVLLALAIIVLTLPAPTVVTQPKPLAAKRPERRALPTQPLSPTEVLPPVGTQPIDAGSAEPEGYTVYRPSTLDD